MLAEASNTYVASNLIDNIAQVLARFDLWPAKSAEFLKARSLAAQSIGAEIAPAEVLRRVHERSGGGLFLTREQGALTGALAFVLLSREGLAAVETDRFDAFDVPLDCIARPSEQPAGLYAWGLCATTRRSARRVVAGARAMRVEITPDLPCFGRAATPAGRRLMVDHLRCKPLPKSRTGILVFEAPAALGRAA